MVAGLLAFAVAPDPLGSVGIRSWGCPAARAANGPVFCGENGQTCGDANSAEVTEARWCGPLKSGCLKSARGLFSSPAGQRVAVVLPSAWAMLASPRQQSTSDAGWPYRAGADPC